MNIFSISETEDNALSDFLEKTMSELNSFFEINWKFNRPRVCIYNNRKTADSLREEKREPWQIGWIEGNNVFVMAREKIGIESPHKKIQDDKEYLSLLKHEVVHCFFNILSKRKYKPDWLWEGIAIYLSGQLEHKKPIEKFDNFIKFYDKTGEEVYKESGFAVKFLIEKFGKERILRLIKALSNIGNSEEFIEKFKDIYGFELSYGNFNID